MFCLSRILGKAIRISFYQHDYQAQTDYHLSKQYLVCYKLFLLDLFAASNHLIDLFHVLQFQFYHFKATYLNQAAIGISSKLTYNTLLQIILRIKYSLSNYYSLKKNFEVHTLFFHFFRECLQFRIVIGLLLLRVLIYRFLLFQLLQ